MPSGGKSRPDGLLGLTMGEARLMLLGILYADNSGKINWNKIVEKGLYKNHASAYTSYRQARKKLIDCNSDSQDASATAPDTSTDTTAENPDPAGGAPKKTSAKRKKAVAKAEPDAENPDGTTAAEDEASSSTSMTKRQRKAPTKKKTTIKTEGEGDEDIIPAPIIKPEPALEQSGLNALDETKNGNIDTNSVIKSEPQPEQASPYKVAEAENEIGKMKTETAEDEITDEAGVLAEFEAIKNGQKLAEGEIISDT